MNSYSYAFDQQYLLDNIAYSKEIDGKTNYFYHFENIDSYLEAVASHAPVYPPKFKNSGEKQFIESKIKDFIKAFQILDGEEQNSIQRIEILRRYAFALAMDYNLDFPNSFNKTKNMFERALSYNFEDAETNLLYGIFLSSTTQYAKSIKFLEKAEHHGYFEAKYRLALVYLFEKDTWPKA